MAVAAERTSQPASSLAFEIEATRQGDGLSAFISVRPRLFSIAYRMLGTVMDAEDIVQEVWLSWQCTNRSVVENPPAFMATITTRLCINVIQSAHSRREAHSESWHPEPVDESRNPGSGAEHSESLRLAMLVLLEKLSPTERAAYILREAFDYSYRQIGDVIGMEEANSRQLVSRARKHIVDSRCTRVTSGEQQRLLEAFIAATQRGNVAALEGFLAEDMISSSDRDRIAGTNGSPFLATSVWQGLVFQNCVSV